MNYSRSTRAVAVGILFSFTWMAIHPSTAQAYNPPTHRNIADWAFRIMRGVSLADPPVPGGPYGATPACNADPVCQAAFPFFASKVGLAVKSLDSLPATFCNGKTDRLLNAPAPRDPNDNRNSKVAKTCGIEDIGLYNAQYPNSSLLSDNNLLPGPGSLTGNWIGYQATSVDYEYDDWHTSLPNPYHLIVYGLGWLITLGDDSAAREFANGYDKAVEGARTAVSFQLILALIMFLLPVFFLLSTQDQEKLLSLIKKFSSKLVNIDSVLLNLLPGAEDLGISGLDSGTLTGLGHFINVQTPLDGIPSSDFDDLPGKHQSQAYWFSNPFQGVRFKMMDSVDHFLIDTEALGAYVNPTKSKGVDLYQIFSPDDGHAASKDRGTLVLTADSYWRNHTLDVTDFTPIDNLGYAGWKQFRDDPCKHVEGLARPLHALQDVTVPMHVLGLTGFGHRPYEDSFDSGSAQMLWDAVRHVVRDSDIGLLHGPNNVPFNAGVEQLEEQEQVKRILRKSFDLFLFISQWRAQHHSTDVPVRDLVTEIAKQTQDYVRNVAVTVTCEADTCSKNTVTEHGANSDFEKVSIDCDPSKCSGLPDLPSHCLALDSDNINGDTTPRCEAVSYAALELSDAQFENLPIPKLMLPGLSMLYKNSQEGISIGFYTAAGVAPSAPAPGSRDFRVLADQRALVELAVAANIAFLTTAPDIITGNLPTSCYSP